MPRPIRGLRISATDRLWLEKTARSRTTPQGLATRCRILLELARGRSVRRVAWTIRPSRATVELWRDRFEQGRHQALAEGRTSVFAVESGTLALDTPRVLASPGGS